uniref:RING-type domain-containing protein n=1 Tax=Pyxicephalus adspersus TaxID=30357 RepID=A0AAV3A5L3_PYXAD|nr:TPA: hypothetical protein GDO54_010626 [Pyxicephalus adspersus]
MLSLHLHTLLHCTICTEKYNETNRRPKLLHCGHTFCLTCLKKIFSSILLLPSNSRNQQLKCPNCRQTTEMFDACYISSLSDNFVIINFLSAEESSKNSKVTHSLLEVAGNLPQKDFLQ